MRRYAQRLGATQIATGHYARVTTVDGVPQLRKGVDAGKDQSYFLHAVAADDLVDVLMPLGELMKSDVREIARQAGLRSPRRRTAPVSASSASGRSRSSSSVLADDPGVIRDDSGAERGRHRGLAYYTLGQRHGLHIGGIADRPENAWYVAAKNSARNELVVVQGHEHPLLKSQALVATDAHWIGPPPREWHAHEPLRCQAKIRYRQPDQSCTVVRTGPASLEVEFDEPQRTPTPGQFVVFYLGDRCLGGATIDAASGRFCRRSVPRVSSPLRTISRL